MNKLDQIDTELLNLIQEGLPLTTRPYQTLGESLGIGEEDVLRRLNALKSAGMIRRLGAVFDSRAMGYYSTLCACRVPEERLEEVAGVISREPGVTHNYQRDHSLNLWFTLTVPDADQGLGIIRRLERETGLKIENMPAKKVFKIKVSFEMGGTDVL
jgi:DNA-binding Lrp family transcriptional regulator